MVTVLASLFFAVLALANAEPNKKLDAEAHLASLEFNRGGYPKKPFKHAIWIPNKDNTGLLAPGVPKQFRHMHAMVASAFFADRADVQQLSMKWLEGYECENILGCEEYFQYYNGALKTVTLTLKNPARARAEKLRKKIQARISALKSNLPSISGLCSPTAERAKWLELGYQLYCPPYEVASAAGFTEEEKENSDTGAMMFLLGMKSHQMLMSSSVVQSFRHKGSHSCQTPWEARLTCSGGFEKTFTLSCQRVGNAFPVQVKCDPE